MLAKIIDTLKDHHPDYSDINLIFPNKLLLSHASQGFQKAVSGLLPSFLDFKEYLVSRISGINGLKPVPRRQEKICFVRFLMQTTGCTLDTALKKTRAVFPILQKISEFGFETSQWDLVFPDTVPLDKLTELYDYKTSFSNFMKDQGKFVFSLCHELIEDISIGEKDYFINIVNLSPPVMDLLKKAGPGRLINTTPCFGKILTESPELSHSIREFCTLTGKRCDPSPDKQIRFAVMPDRMTVFHYIGNRVLEALESGKVPFHIVMLQETMALELWNNVLRHFGDNINFTIGIALCQSSVGSSILKKIAESGHIDIKSLVDHLKSLFGNETLDISEKFAAEAAYEFLKRWDLIIRENDFFSKDDLLTLIKYEIAQEQFFIKGSRDAPVQVTGLMNSYGSEYHDSIIFPMNEGIFPAKPKEELFLNETYTPEIKKVSAMIDDLYLRQYLAYGKRATIAAIDDSTRAAVPSYYFHFLRNEFNPEASSEKYNLVPEITRCLSEAVPMISLTEQEKELLIRRPYSFSSLTNLIGCGFRFYYLNVKKLAIPQIFDDSDDINLDSGTFIHEFIQQLGDCEPSNWIDFYNHLWDKGSGIPEKLRQRKDHHYRRKILFLYLKNCIEVLDRGSFHDHYILSSGSKRELKLNYSSDGIQYTGSLDKVFINGDTAKIIDFKFKKNKARSIHVGKPLADQLFKYSREGRLKGLRDTAQLFIYIFLLRNLKNSENLKITGNFLYIKENNPEKIVSEDFTCTKEEGVLFMARMSSLVKEIIDHGSLQPNYQSDLCSFCRLQSICRKKEFYRV